MRICLYTETALPMIGGQELAIDALARQFLAQGHEPVVLAPVPRRGWQADDTSFPYPVIRHPRFISTRRFVASYRWFLARAHRRYRFDILHCHSVYPTGYTAARWAEKSGVPVVITSHSGDISPESRLLAKPGLPDRFRLALERAAAVIAISDFTEQRLRALCPQICRLERIPNGVDVRRFATPVPRPATLEAAIQPQRYFLFLGRFVHRKGADLLLDAFAIASAANDLHLVLAGSGPEEAALRAQAARFGLPNRVHFVGHVDGDRKTWLLQNAFSTVIPSRISEGFPLVLLESTAAGTPVVGTRISGLEDLVDCDRSGVLADAESASDLARALRQVATDHDLTDRPATEPRRLSASYDWRRVAASHLALFEDVAQTPRKLRAA
jgi:glycosyltransferase involved in cell wall biosynthesis